jgi:hypothetical protein
MLFVVNRIDELRRNGKWPDQEDEFVAQIKTKIVSYLEEALPEYSSELSGINVVRLSSEAALLARQIRSEHGERRHSAADRLDGQFNSLIPRNLLGTLPRMVTDWSESQFVEVADAVERASYCDNFYRMLFAHISERLPDIVIPPALHRFVNSAGAPVKEWALHTVSSMLNGTEEKYKIETERVRKLQPT